MHFLHLNPKISGKKLHPPNRQRGKPRKLTARMQKMRLQSQFSTTLRTHTGLMLTFWSLKNQVFFCTWTRDAYGAQNCYDLKRENLVKKRTERAIEKAMGKEKVLITYLPFKPQHGLKVKRLGGCYRKGENLLKRNFLALQLETAPYLAASDDVSFMVYGKCD